MRRAPREERFFDLFEEIAEKVTIGAETLEDALRDPKNLAEAAIRLRELEHQADLLVHESMDRLNKKLVMPIDREDIHALTHALDDVLDYTESALDHIMLFDIKDTLPNGIEMAQVLVKSCQQLREGVAGLRNFDDIRGILDPCVRINELENKGDALNREAIRSLFNSNHDAITIIKWKEVYDHLETAIDRCEDVADVLESIAVKNS